MTFAGTPRPRARWCHAQTELDDFVMVTYRVDLDRVDALTAGGFVPTEFTFDDGKRGALVSAVAFTDRDFAFRFAPFVRVSCGQINYRAYGTFRGERGVWFFGTSLDSVFVALPRRVWSMPWHRDVVRLAGDWDGDRPRRVVLRAQGSWGAAGFDVAGTDATLGRLDGFADVDETIEVLTHPMVGWYERGDGVGRYSVWHPVLEPVPCTVSHCEFRVFEDLGLVAPGAEPHSVLAQRTVHFDVHTPPTSAR